MAHSLPITSEQAWLIFNAFIHHSKAYVAKGGTAEYRGNVIIRDACLNAAGLPSLPKIEQIAVLGSD